MSAPIAYHDPDLMRLWARFIRLNGRIQAAVSAQLKEIGLSIPQFDLISVLAQREGLTQQEIAERLLVTKGNVSGLVDRLAAAGLVERRTTAADRRSNAVHLTEAGRRIAESGMRKHEDFVAETLGRLSEPDRATLDRLIVGWRDLVRAEFARRPAATDD